MGQGRSYAVLRCVMQDLRHLAEAFISKEAAPARARLVATLSEALYARGSLGQVHAGVPGAQGGEDLGTGRPQSAGLSLLAASSRGSGASALGLERMGSPSQLASPRGGRLDEGATGVARAPPRPSTLAPGRSGAPGAGQDGARAEPLGNRGRMKRKRLWWLLRSALGRMEGGATLRLRVVLAALLLLLAALLLALRNMLLDSVLQLRRALSAWQVTPAGGLP